MSRRNNTGGREWRVEEGKGTLLRETNSILDFLHLHSTKKKKKKKGHCPCAAVQTPAGDVLDWIKILDFEENNE